MTKTKKKTKADDTIPAKAVAVSCLHVFLQRWMSTYKTYKGQPGSHLLHACITELEEMVSKQSDALIDKLSDRCYQLENELAQVRSD